MKIFVIITSIIAGISFLYAELAYFFMGGTNPTEQEVIIHYLEIVTCLLFAIFLLLIQGPIKIIFW